MKKKTYSICIEKDLDIVNDAQVVVDIINNGWNITVNNYANPLIVTVFKWFTIECDDIETYKEIIFNYGSETGMRLTDCIEET